MDWARRELGLHSYLPAPSSFSCAFPIQALPCWSVCSAVDVGEGVTATADFCGCGCGWAEGADVQVALSSWGKRQKVALVTSHLKSTRQAPASPFSHQRLNSSAQVSEDGDLRVCV